MINQETENLIRKKLESGRYSNPEEVVQAALAALDLQERFGDFKPDELDMLLAEGEASIEQHGVISGETVFEELRQRGSRPRAETA